MKFKYPISNINQSTFSDYVNNSKQFFEWTMAVNHEANQNQASSFPEGSFKAVCLSGLRSNNNTGGSDRVEDGFTGGGSYCNIIVRPLDSVGFDLAIPDPRKFADPRISPNEQTQLINLAIASHKPLYIARSNFKIYSKTSIEFGQIVECYFESGNISKGNAGGLRFKKPSSPPDFGDGSFRNLAEIPGVSTSDLDFQGTRTNLLGDIQNISNLEQALELGLSSNIKGDRTRELKFIVIHYSATVGSLKSALNSINKNPKSLGYHYMIDRNGAFYETCPPDKNVWHCGGGNKKVTSGSVINGNSVGVCIVNAGYERDSAKPGDYETLDVWQEGKFPNGNPGDSTSKTSKGLFEPYTRESYNTAVKIVANLLDKYPNIQAYDIVGHSDMSTSKSDPGPLWDMEKFRTDVISKSKRGQATNDSSETAELYESLTR